MANLNPSIRINPYKTGLEREKDVLERLELSLPAGFEIFHNINWQTIDEGHDRRGELDIVVISPIGNIVLLEVKAGSVDIKDGQVIKIYSDGPSDVGRQTRVQFQAMLSRLKEAGIKGYISNLLVLPDYNLNGQPVVAIPAERIIDSTKFDRLGTYVKELIDASGHHGDPEALHRFFSNEFKVIPDMRVLGEQIRTTTKRLADGLATWIPRITAPLGVVRIQATAGSGKTQLALRLLQEAIANNKRSLYVCYNRALADHIVCIASPRAKISSFHELCVEHYRKTQGEPDFSEQGIFQKLGELYCEAISNDSTLHARYDMIIIDEGQDFDPAWMESLFPQLVSQGNLYLLEDESQRLYERIEFDLNDAVVVTCQDNFRSPKMICEVINYLKLTKLPVHACGPYIGDLPGMHVYSSEKSLERKTADAIKNLLARGIALSDIAVISWRGLLKSKLMQLDKIEDYAVKRPTGKFTPAGDALWTKGDLLVDSVYRFKGQSAAGIVLSEIDFESLGEIDKRKLFVGLTRAQIAIELVMSEQASKLFTELS